MNQKEIDAVFRDLNLDTNEKRRKFAELSRVGQTQEPPEHVDVITTEANTLALENEFDGELERHTR